GARSVRTQVPADTRLFMSEADGTTDVPGHGPLGLAILSLGGNPGRGAIPVSFRVPRDSDAHVELLDTAGRRIELQRSPKGVAGVRQLVLAQALVLAPGLYLVRVHQGGRTATAKVTRMR
ncbi:MAG: T9SS type A sorting domain-containing protein, partial [Candidatus Eisenbacteria bacterium]